jgi:hypothetical protein
MTLRFGMVALALVSFASLATVAGCSGNDGKIEVDSGSAALTDQGNDTLFTIKLVEARADGYAMDSVKVKVTPEDKDAIEVTCKLTDVNANGKLDKGDTLSCTEPAENKLGKDLAGKEIDVELFATIDGAEERVGDATYDAK